jgi:hypothetical protein
MTLPEHAVYNELDIIRRIAWDDDKPEIEALKL